MNPIPVWIEWNIDPAQLPHRQWFYAVEGEMVTDRVQIAAESIERRDEDEQLHAWDIQLRITGIVEQSWNTYGEMRLLQQAAFALLEPGASFLLWHGCELAVITVLEDGYVPGLTSGASQPDRYEVI
ncbi:hypothetical protein ACE3MZ_22615 [Paenibacillus sp. WLX1005]|uniref:hypothetical protein n=1 Tax=Paenibacillus sp. WLX1005 TaxID=3243766 RepID=UPI003983E4CD